MDVLDKELKCELQAPMQVWNADDFSATAIIRAARPLMQWLGEISPSRGVFLEPVRSQYVHPDEVPEAATKIATMVTTMKNKARNRSLGGHIGSLRTCDAWIKAQVADWAHKETSLGKIVRSSPQTYYSGLVKSLQNEWNYL